MNTFDDSPRIGDPDDILDIVVQPQRPTAAPASAGTPPLPVSESAPGLQPAPVALTTPPAVNWQAQHPAANPAVRYPEAREMWGVDGPYTPDRPEELSAEESASEPHWFGVMVREVVETVGLAVIIFLIIRVGIQNYRIEGASMEPNFHDGEYLIVNKLAYRLGEYERGDVIVFKYPNDPSKDYIKRVIGLPGDTVEIRAGELYVNGVLIQEPYPHLPNVRDEPPTVVDAGHLYVMGDNRPASSDTRSWGQLGQEFVIGQAWLAIYPINQFGLVEHQPIEVNSVMAQGP